MKRRDKNVILIMINAGDELIKMDLPKTRQAYQRMLETMYEELRDLDLLPEVNASGYDRNGDVIH